MSETAEKAILCRERRVDQGAKLITRTGAFIVLPNKPCGCSARMRRIPFHPVVVALRWADTAIPVPARAQPRRGGPLRLLASGSGLLFSPIRKNLLHKSIRSR